MRLILCFFVALTVLSCSSSKKSINAATGSGGVWISSVDSGLIKGSNIIRLSENSTAVTFSEKFAKKHFARAPWINDTLFFTPDTNLIKRIDIEINDHYCSALKEYYKEKNLEGIGDVYCKLWEKNYKYYDKQYIGYISKEGRKILYVNLIDFREDPNHLKPYLITS